MQCLVENPNFFSDLGGKQAVELAVQTNNFKALIRLFDHGADPVYLSVESGDTPIHAALKIALERDKGIYAFKQ